MEKGFIILDKPAGMTSFEACDAARKKLGADKAGHAGTLDPMVTGILIIALESATKLMPLINGLDKTYDGEAHIHKDVSLSELKKIIKEKFLGKIKQIPPQKSRVRRIEREREIYEFKILKKTGRDIFYRVHCEKGTYIRKLIDDLGKEIGGAHMTALRRIKQGPFPIKMAVPLDKLTEKNIIPAEKIIEKVSPIIFVSAEAETKLRQGKFLNAEDVEKIKGSFEKEQIAAAICGKRVVALVKPFFSSPEIKKQKVYILKPERII